MVTSEDKQALEHILMVSAYQILDKPLIGVTPEEIAQAIVTALGEFEPPPHPPTPEPEEPPEPQPKQYITARDYVWVYPSPRTDVKSIGYLHRGVIVDVYEVKGMWAEILFGTRTAYIYADTLRYYGNYICLPK